METEIRLELRQWWCWHWDRSISLSLTFKSSSSSPNTTYTFTGLPASLFINKSLLNLRPQRTQPIDHTPVPVPPFSPPNCSGDCDKITRRDSLETAVSWSDVKLQHDFQLLAQLSHSHNPIHSPSSLLATHNSLQKPFILLLKEWERWEERAQRKKRVCLSVCVFIERGMKERKCRREGYGVCAPHLHTLYMQDSRIPLVENEYPGLRLLPWTHPVPCWPLSLLKHTLCDTFSLSVQTHAYAGLGFIKKKNYINPATHIQTSIVVIKSIK